MRRRPGGQFNSNMERMEHFNSFGTMIGYSKRNRHMERMGIATPMGG